MRSFNPEGGVTALGTMCRASVASLRTFARNVSARSVGYGLVAQLCSSATNLALAIIAGHVLGPSGLGTIFVGFAAYVSLLSLERALLTDPLVAASSAREPAERAASARFAVTLALAAGLPAAGLLAGVGAVLPTQFGRGMLLFAPWLVPALIQDLGRSIVFRDQRGSKTALSDSTWLLTMAVVAPLAFETQSDWAVVGCWGAGAVAGAAVAVRQVRWRPSRLGVAFAWWKSESWRFGRWLALQATFRSVCSYTGVLALTGILGTGGYGGLRAVYTAFAPLSLLGPALALPGLPLVSRILGVSARRALTTAAQLGLVITLLTGVYVVVLLSLPGTLSFLFGQAFVQFRSILVPIGVGQLVLAPTYGLTLFLMAQQRGRTLLGLGMLLATFQLTFGVGFALLFGLQGAAWGGAAVASSLWALVFIAAFRRNARGCWHGHD